LFYEEREQTGTQTKKQLHMAKILDSFLQSFIASSNQIHTSTPSSFMMIFCKMKVQCCQELACLCLGPGWKIFLFSLNVTQNIYGMLWYIPSFAPPFYPSRQDPRLAVSIMAGRKYDVSFAGTLPSWYRAQYGLLTKLWRRATHCFVYFDISILRGRGKELEV
jgi:hypothetical protein